MFYVTSKALGEAMVQGRKHPAGTIYGIYATRAAAEAALAKRKVIVGKGDEKFRMTYGMIVEL
jgi:hypothetical protein